VVADRARDVIDDPVQHALRLPAASQALGAAFGEKSGWERVNWFETNAAGGDESLRPRGWAGRNWSPAIERECLAARDAAALFDESSFAKIDVHGPGALAFLEGLCANLIGRPTGSVVYTQLLNRRGGIECDLTVTRLAEDRFQLVTGTAFGAHDLGWLRRHLPGDGSVYVDDVTASRTCLGLWGPRSREILELLTKSDLSHAAFPYLRAREIAVGDVPCLALRVTYVGELGFELYCPTEYGLALWDALVAAGEPRGLVPAGYRAIDSLRLEKGYRAWGSDITPETTHEAAGLGFAVRLDKPIPFAGRDALLAERDAGGPAERLRCLVLDDPRAVCLGGEPVRVAGVTAGRVTSGGYGHRVERSIAYAYLPAAGSGHGTRVEIDVFGTRVGAGVVSEPIWDPGNARIR
jgi:glycine cleavage system aminomethyltransferase T